MNLAEYIEKRMEEKGIRKNWLAEKLNMNYKTFVGKMKRNSITGEEILLISHYLDLNLNQLKEIFVKKHENGE
ncbi:hypothetical protein [Niallia taxi]|uniref:hypothetical protein n=1 Tax=Niallia taxi TaxID=2499688 RepID=UPI003009EC79